MAKDHTPRGLRDEASVGPAPRQSRPLKPLGDLNFRVAAGEPDIRGWSVFASTGRELGKVHELLVDPDAGEVVMLDIDLRRGDRHTLAPIRAAWIDHATKRVVLDAREVESEDALPAMSRTAALSDDDVRRFNDDYVHAYGERGAERDREYRLRRGEEELRFGMAPRADLPPADARRADERLERERPTDVRLADERAREAREAREARDARLRDERRDDDRLRNHPLRDTATFAAGAAAADAAATDASRDASGAYFDESRRIDRLMDDPTIARQRREHATDERRAERVDDASALRDADAIDPRELDARVRIDEGATVDDRAPVGGVRYEGGITEPHGYGQPEDRYGKEYGDGRIGFDRVVSRHPYRADEIADPTPEERERQDQVARDAAEAARRANAAGEGEANREVRYRRYDDAPRTDR